MTRLSKRVRYAEKAGSFFDMAKDPAFLFYPNDYIGGTMGMTFEEKGAYIELLMMQFNRGHMTSHMIGQTVGQLWDKLQDKFIQDDEGLWYNERLQDEQIARQKFTNSRRNNISGKNQFTGKNKVEDKKVGHTVGHKTSHMENEDIIEYYKKEIDNNIDKDKIEYYKAFANFLFKSNPSGKPITEILKIPNQVDYEDFCKLFSRAGGDMKQIFDKLATMMNDTKYTKGKKFLFLTLNNWFNQDAKRKP